MAEHNQRFDSFEQWVDRAQSWLTRHPKFDQKFYRAVCFDSRGNILLVGGDFRDAAYPVHWVWPDQNLFERIKLIQEEGNDR